LEDFGRLSLSLDTKGRRTVGPSNQFIQDGGHSYQHTYRNVN